MATTKCENTTPLHTKDAKGKPRRSSICPACGGDLMILTSGVFRRHNPVMKANNPRIAENIASENAEYGN